MLAFLWCWQMGHDNIAVGVRLTLAGWMTRGPLFPGWPLLHCPGFGTVCGSFASVSGSTLSSARAWSVAGACGSLLVCDSLVLRSRFLFRLQLVRGRFAVGSRRGFVALSRFCLRLVRGWFVRVAPATGLAPLLSWFPSRLLWFAFHCWFVKLPYSLLLLPIPTRCAIGSGWFLRKSYLVDDSSWLVLLRSSSLLACFCCAFGGCCWRTADVFRQI